MKTCRVPSAECGVPSAECGVRSADSGLGIEVTEAPANIPGPRARFPGDISFAFRLEPLRFLERTWREYGNLSAFRVGRLQYFLANDPEVTRDVLVAKAGSFIKSPALRQAKITLGEGLLTSEGDFHRRQRRLSQPAFHPNRVARYAEPMVRRARQTSDGWGDGQVVDMHAEMMRLTLRVVTETLFSANIDAEIDEIGRSMDVMVAMFRRARNPLAPLLNRLPLPSNYRFLRSMAKVRATVDRFVRENRAAGVDRGDLLSTLIAARDTGGDIDDDSAVVVDRAAPADPAAGMTDPQLRDEIITLFTAGHETTANALTFTWWLLSHHPEVVARLHEEVDAVLADPERSLTTDDLDRLPYTRAVVAESMRLYPPAWTLMRQATQDVRVGPQGHLIPRDAVIVTPQWIAHRDPRWWPEPEKFNPQRWLDPAARDSRPKYAYFPFGGGVRSCIGEAFAWTEAILIVATLARHWEMQDVSTTPMRLLPTITLRPKDPVWMKLRRRG